MLRATCCASPRGHRSVDFAVANRRPGKRVLAEMPGLTRRLTSTTVAEEADVPGCRSPSSPHRDEVVLISRASASADGEPTSRRDRHGVSAGVALQAPYSPRPSVCRVWWATVRCPWDSRVSDIDPGFACTRSLSHGGVTDHRCHLPVSHRAIVGHRSAHAPPRGVRAYPPRGKSCAVCVSPRKAAPGLPASAAPYATDQFRTHPR